MYTLYKIYQKIYIVVDYNSIIDPEKCAWNLPVLLLLPNMECLLQIYVQISDFSFLLLTQQMNERRERKQRLPHMMIILK